MINPWLDEIKIVVLKEESLGVWSSKLHMGFTNSKDQTHD